MFIKSINQYILQKIAIKWKQFLVLPEPELPPQCDDISSAATATNGTWFTATLSYNSLF